jgi:hypothetical protein
VMRSDKMQARSSILAEECLFGPTHLKEDLARISTLIGRRKKAVMRAY